MDVGLRLRANQIGIKDATASKENDDAKQYSNP